MWNWKYVFAKFKYKIRNLYFSYIICETDAVLLDIKLRACILSFL